MTSIILGCTIQHLKWCTKRHFQKLYEGCIGTKSARMYRKENRTIL
uniref:Uncharacterized protein n=1 Tax=Anguilla anguilla TaxID=7936 RepID=A0A0E9RE30_ANGAN